MQGTNFNHVGITFTFVPDEKNGGKRSEDNSPWTKERARGFPESQQIMLKTSMRRGG